MAFLYELGQARAGLGHDLDAVGVVANQLREPFRCQRACRRHHAHLAVAGDGGAGLHRRLQPHDRDHQGLPQLLERRPRGGVACRDEQLRPGALDVAADRESTRAHLFERTVAVRAVGGIGDVEQILRGQDAPDLAGDAQAAHAGVEDADGPPRAIHQA